MKKITLPLHRKNKQKIMQSTAKHISLRSTKNYPFQDKNVCWVHGIFK